MRVVMIGAGYVGLVSGACFADFGHEVICVDQDEERIARLRDGVMPIYEPGLEALVASNVEGGRLSFATVPDEAVKSADVVFLAVGTPARRGDGHADLSYVYAAAEEVGRLIERYTVIVTKSTVPVGTGDEVEKIVRKVARGVDFDVCSNPEFLREGAAISDFKRPDRVVVGTSSFRAEGLLRELYRPLYLNETPLLVTDRRTAELTKYAANAFLATKIAFINEMADLCEKAGGNVQDIARGIGLDKRIGPKFLNVGPGFGGSCFPKDTLALSRSAEIFGSPASIVDAVVAANDKRKASLAARVVEAAGGSVAGRTIAILGLTFKPNTDDMRDAPSLALIPALQDAGARIRAFDPEGRHEAEKHFRDITYADGPYGCLEGADLAVIVTEWDLFRALDLRRMAAALSERLLVDFRNIYGPTDAAAAGLRYHSLGRPTPRHPERTDHLREVV